MEGFLLIHKPCGITSYACIARLKACVGRKARIGHAGTLDKFAEGLLIIGFGRTATRELSMFMQLDKKYRACAKLGEVTDTLDYTGTVLETGTVSADMHHALEYAVANFDSEYMQTPPIFSALKHEGYSLSDLLRWGRMSSEELQVVVTHKQKKVRLFALHLQNITLPFFTIDAHVSHGTYIRTLADDIAKKIKTRATTYELVRYQIGPFLLEEAITIDAFSRLHDIHHYLISIEDMKSRLLLVSE